MAARGTKTEAEYRQQRRKYDRLYKAGPASGVRVRDPRMVIPDDIEVRPISAPCFRCEARGACRHRELEAA